MALIGVLERTPDHERAAAVDAVVANFGDRFAGLPSPNAARAAFGEAYATCRAGTVTLRMAAAVLGDRGPRRIAPAAHWLAGKAAELDGRTTDAERHYERALSVDPTWDEALEALARFASDRGAQIRSVHDDDPFALYHALDDPLIADVVLFESRAPGVECAVRLRRDHHVRRQRIPGR